MSIVYVVRKNEKRLKNQNTDLSGYEMGTQMWCASKLKLLVCLPSREGANRTTRHNEGSLFFFFFLLEKPICCM